MSDASHFRAREIQVSSSADDDWKVMLGYMLDYLRRAIADPGKVVFNSKKRIAIAIVVPFLAWVVFSVMPAPGSSSRRTSERAESRMTVIAANSLCLADASAATIHFRIAVRNDGLASGDLGLTPWRRYSDNSVNDSAMDAVTAEGVPPGETKLFKTEFGYNAEDHRLIECGVKVDGELTTFAVVD